MNDDYLWDGSGEPDPEIQKLESALGKLRHNRAAPAFPEITATHVQAARRSFWQAFLFPRFAAVATGILVIAAISFFTLRPKPNPNSGTGWDVTRVTGTPRIGRDTLGAQNATGKLGLGQMLETDNQSRANIRVEEVGEIVVDPGTRLRLPDSSSGVHRLALDRGTIHASIWAPAGEFVIDTPSAMAVDLGCAYTLHVDDSGNGVLHTTLGWVGFKLADHEAFIPAGAACSTKRKTGPDTPYFEDASPAFLAALSTFDLESLTPEERAAALDVVLAQSRKHDALTLWHLLTRVTEPDRGRVYDRLAHFVPAPAGVTREGILRLDRNMLDLWWNELGFGDTELWRHWERTWPDKSTKSSK
jgi:FecR-like protein